MSMASLPHTGAPAPCGHHKKGLDTMQIERLGTLQTDLGECPVWDTDSQTLWMLDCRKGRLYTVDPQTGRDRFCELPAPLGSFALNGKDSLVVALKEDVAIYTPSTGKLRRVASIDDRHPNLRLNDGAAMPDGSFVVGTMHILRNPGEVPLGGLYRLDPAGGFTRLDRGLGVVNGPVPHPSRPEFYVCDSAARSIYRYRIDSAGAWSGREPFVDTEPYGSAPDGCCFDSEGGLWTALVYVGAIARFDAEGRLTHRIDLPVAHPASLCFGGPTLDDIYVTTIRDSGRLSAQGPLDGALLRVRGAGLRGAARTHCRVQA
jgi:sugar lactone lactonase YvrE